MGELTLFGREESIMLVYHTRTYSKLGPRRLAPHDNILRTKRDRDESPFQSSQEPKIPGEK